MIDKLGKLSTNKDNNYIFDRADDVLRIKINEIIDFLNERFAEIDQDCVIDEIFSEPVDVTDRVASGSLPEGW